MSRALDQDILALTTPPLINVFSTYPDARP